MNLLLATAQPHHAFLTRAETKRRSCEAVVKHWRKAGPARLGPQPPPPPARNGGKARFCGVFSPETRGTHCHSHIRVNACSLGRKIVAPLFIRWLKGGWQAAWGALRVGGFCGEAQPRAARLLPTLHTPWGIHVTLTSEPRLRAVDDGQRLCGSQATCMILYLSTRSIRPGCLRLGPGKRCCGACYDDGLRHHR